MGSAGADSPLAEVAAAAGISNSGSWADNSDVTPEQIADELMPRVRGRVLTDDLSRRLYSTDASPFQILPAAVVLPVDAADAATAVAFASRHGVPIVPRGGGTGLAGEALTSGIVLDLSVHCRSIVEIGDDWARVQPGVTCRELNAALAPRGRRFAPEPASGATATLGGMIATNASGITAFRHGTTREHLAALTMLWDDGSISTVGQPVNGAGMNTPSTDRGAVCQQALCDLLLANADLIRTARLRLPHARNPYPLDDLLSREGVNLVKLLAGSEGTLGIVTEAVVRTVPQPGGMAACVVGFPALDDALAAGLSLAAHPDVAGCDLLDQRLLSMVRSADGTLAVPHDIAAAMVILFESASEASALAAAAAALKPLRAGGVVLAEPAAEEAHRERVARLREAGVNGFYGRGSRRRAEAFVEDLAVPPAALAAFVTDVQRILREQDLAGSLLIHVLTGIVHCRPLIDFSNPAERAKAWPLAEQLFHLTLAYGGTISAQHGIGIARTPWIEHEFAPLMPIIREIKRIFDPQGILNPGKITELDPARPTWPFRMSGPPDASGSGNGARVVLNLFDAPGFAAEVERCNSCGDCRSRQLPGRMCPAFRVSGEERAAPRGMAHALQAALEQPARLQDDDLKAVARQCIHCLQCRRECYAGIDLPSLMAEAKAAYHQAHGFDRGEWLIARSERLAAWAGTFAFSANMLLSLRPTRWLLEKLTGLSRRRMLHRFTHRSYLRKRLVRRLFRREFADGPGRKFAYFLDTFANYNDPLIAEAAVAVLEHHGLRVHVPRRQRGCGMAALSVGDLETARQRAAYNVRTFAELVRDGFEVVCSEPTAAVALMQEYPRLLGTEEARLVAEHTVELSALLGQLQAAGELKPLTRRIDLAIAHHAPCHLKALGPVRSPALLDLIPGLTVRRVEAGCSGAAGAWGFAAVNHETSLQMGAPLFAALRQSGSALAASECSACRMQIQQGAGLRGLHPVQLLALGYGLVPALEARFTRPLRPRLTG